MDKSTGIERKKSRKPRLKGEERRHAILDKAATLVKAKGEDRVTTRLLAKEAAISESLLYQHFPSKDELFREVSVVANARSPALHEYFADAEPSSRVMVDYLYLVSFFALSPEVRTGDEKLPRMLLESLLGDGSLARTHIKRSWVFIGKLLTDSLEAARKAGHLVDRQNKDQDPETLELMLSHQLVVMAHCMRFLPDQPILGPELGHSDEMIDRTVVFLLRGLGFKEGAIKKLLHPDKILARFRKKIPL